MKKNNSSDLGYTKNGSRLQNFSQGDKKMSASPDSQHRALMGLKGALAVGTLGEVRLALHEARRRDVDPNLIQSTAQECLAAFPGLDRPNVDIVLLFKNQ
ncbi:MAG: hypothetical protein A2951_01420 [Candidatus Buchananbacteria bacterium RIFCSPLOWO2_01_FULL_56_15]|uniref:Uncharacterized protein n=2 Tax=Candidatus Buchananiibacteriota TaxID=1817903 RepID=A0A1G1YR21_9BACT|nr:MAG: hypothetical protein A2951_01420 [Candidatus Buchananbacteria bacterium RIFCSPLOWO2_01_FULL_56_15]